MQTITNKTHKPLRIPLPGGKALHLGPSKSGQIADGASTSPAILRLIKEGQIEIQGDGRHGNAGTGEGGGHGGEATHGHPPTTTVQKRGNR